MQSDLPSSMAPCTIGCENANPCLRKWPFILLNLKIISMKRRTTLLFVCFVLLYSGINAQSSIEYYVDGSLTTNGNGTSASPWNRIWYAINRSPRDTTKDAIVYIKRGSYVIDANDFLTQLYIGSANGGANTLPMAKKP